MYTPFMGMIGVYGFDFAPKGWALCSGQLMSVSQNQALFALLGVAYGGDGLNTFALPDLRSRRIVGAGQDYTIGQTGGQESIVLKTSQMPPHTHTGTFSIRANGDARADVSDPTGAYMGTPDGDGLNTYADKSAATGMLGAPQVRLSSTGANQPVSTLSQGLALTCSIALSGIFPSRG